MGKQFKFWIGMNISCFPMIDQHITEQCRVTKDLKRTKPIPDVLQCYGRQLTGLIVLPLVYMLGKKKIKDFCSNLNEAYLGTYKVQVT